MIPLFLVSLDELNIRFLSFGGGVPYRPVEDLAFAVARFFQRGGTFQNYYMVEPVTGTALVSALYIQVHLQDQIFILS